MKLVRTDALTVHVDARFVPPMRAHDYTDLLDDIRA